MGQPKNFDFFPNELPYSSSQLYASLFEKLNSKSVLQESTLHSVHLSGRLRATRNLRPYSQGECNELHADTGENSTRGGEDPPHDLSSQQYHTKVTPRPRKVRQALPL